MTGEGLGTETVVSGTGVVEASGASEVDILQECFVWLGSSSMRSSLLVDFWRSRDEHARKKREQRQHAQLDSPLLEGISARHFPIRQNREAMMRRQ